MLFNLVFDIVFFLIILVPLLICIAFLTLLERKVMGSIQTRRGPNIIGFWGVLQPFADGLKLLLKETIIPYRANNILFFFSPVFSFLLSLLGWLVIPFFSNFTGSLLFLNISVLYIFMLSSLNVYGILLGGWSSNSRYTILGSLRSAAQMLSYEVSFGLALMPVILLAGSLSFYDIVQNQRDFWFIYVLLPIFFVFVISVLAETNRIPFDLPEAEAELVSGFNTEYSSMVFALFFLAEYSNIILAAFLINLFFLGGWYSIFGNISLFFFMLKLICCIYFFLWVRSSFPRYRYDQLMRIGWKVFLPFCLGYLLFIIGFYIAF